MDRLSALYCLGLVCFTPLDEFVYMISPIYFLSFLSTVCSINPVDPDCQPTSSLGDQKAKLQACFINWCSTLIKYVCGVSAVRLCLIHGVLD
jgi:hypothetical protein